MSMTKNSRINRDITALRTHLKGMFDVVEAYEANNLTYLSGYREIVSECKDVGKEIDLLVSAAAGAFSSTPISSRVITRYYR